MFEQVEKHERKTDPILPKIKTITVQRAEIEQGGREIVAHEQCQHRQHECGNGPHARFESMQRPRNKKPHQRKHRENERQLVKPAEPWIEIEKIRFRQKEQPFHARQQQEREQEPAPASTEFSHRCETEI